MRRRLPPAVALPVTALVLSMTVVPAAAAVPTTPVPPPKEPGQPPISAPNGPQPLGHAVGDAAAAVGDLQVFPGLVDTGTIIPGFGENLPKQPLFEGGVGTSSAQANSESFLSTEKSIAESAPIAGAVAGNSPQLPGALAQNALPDNKEPVTGGQQFPKNPLLNVNLFRGSAHARYSPTLGPCVQPLSDASTTVADVSAVQLPKFPDLPLADMVTPQTLSRLAKPVQEAMQQKRPGAAGLLATLSPQAKQGKAMPDDDSGAALLDAPGTIHSRSQVKLVDMPGTENKAVQSVSNLQLADLTLFKGVPVLQSTIKIASQPKLTVTSTGKKETSTVDYEAPALEVSLFGQDPIRVDARHPLEAPMLSIPAPEIIPADIRKQFQDRFGMLLDRFKDVPLFGDAAQWLQDRLDQAGDGGFVLDLGILRLSVGQLKQNGQQQTKGKDGAPYDGYQLGARAKLFDLEILPTDALKLNKGPSAVADVSMGKQVGRAYAPTNGVECGTTQPPSSSTQPAPPGPKPQGTPPKPPLAYTDAAYHVVPLFWTGTGLLLAGAVLMAALPRRRPRKAEADK